jgi:tRNA (cytidine/uridine-2'-O-)-methyltransferase
MRLALYEPDIPQNAGALLRLGACLGVAIDIIGPAGFVLSDRRLKRAGMDYLDLAELTRHAS